MEVKIGIQNIGREIVLESAQDADAVAPAVTSNLAEPVNVVLPSPELAVSVSAGADSGGAVGVAGADGATYGRGGLQGDVAAAQGGETDARAHEVHQAGDEQSDSHAAIMRWRPVGIAAACRPLGAKNRGGRQQDPAEAAAGRVAGGQPPGGWRNSFRFAPSGTEPDRTDGIDAPVLPA